MNELSKSSQARFDADVTSLAEVVGHADRCEPLHDYCVGLLMPCERKSVEPKTSARRLAYPKIVDPVAPPTRPEPHVPSSIATLGRYPPSLWQRHSCDVQAAKRSKPAKPIIESHDTVELGYGCRHRRRVIIRLYVDQRRSVETIKAFNDEDIAFDAEQRHDRRSDRIGPCR